MSRYSPGVWILSLSENPLHLRQVFISISLPEPLLRHHPNASSIPCHPQTAVQLGRFGTGRSGASLLPVPISPSRSREVSA